MLELIRLNCSQLRKLDINQIYLIGGIIKKIRKNREKKLEYYNTPPPPTFILSSLLFLFLNEFLPSEEKIAIPDGRSNRGTAISLAFNDAKLLKIYDIKKNIIEMYPTGIKYDIHMDEPRFTHGSNQRKTIVEEIFYVLNPHFNRFSFELLHYVRWQQV